MAIKFPDSIEFLPDPADEASGATLGQVLDLSGAEGITDEVLAALEPPIDLTVVFENALT